MGGDFSDGPMPLGGGFAILLGTVSVLGVVLTEPKIAEIAEVDPDNLDARR